MNIKTVYSFAIISSAFVYNLAMALPQAGTVAAGSASISQAGTTTTINQTSSSAVINWQSFDTAGNETVRFNQPNVNSTVLNRINSGLPTNFAGSLKANGKVFIVNPAGMVFVGGSHVNTSGFVASTTDIKNQDFMNGNYHFAIPTSNNNASIINNGIIKTDNSGVVALIAPNVVNSQTGIIQADSGTVALASGKAFVLDFNQDQLINFDATAAVKTGHIENAGVISAQGGKVFMTANAVTQVLDSLSSTGNTTEATAVAVTQNGNIVLSGKVNADQVALNATNGIDVNAPVVANRFGFTATTKKGNININNIIDAGYADVSLTASAGAIKETGTGGVVANHLTTNSSLGTNLNSVDNKIFFFTATNGLMGDISLNDPSGVNIAGIFQNGGNLNITAANGIFQGDLPDSRIKVTGKSSFTSTNARIVLTSDNQFMGAVSFSSPDYVLVRNSSYNIVLDKISVAGKLTINNTAGSISQSENGVLNIGGDMDITTADAPITLNNSGNQIRGYITLGNSKYSNQNISLNNSVDTSIDSVTAGGAINITSAGRLDVSDSLTSFAKNPVNGHSVVLNASKISSRLYRQSGKINAGENNSFLIYVPNSDAISYSLVFSPLNRPTEIWNKPYLANGPEAISEGSYLIYADKKPVTT